MEITQDHISFVRHTARSYRHWDTGELESAGLEGLAKAANNFDPARGTTFETWATRLISQAMLKELRKPRMTPVEMVDFADPSSEIYENGEIARCVWQVIAGQAKKRQEILKLYFFEGWKMFELAAEFGLATSTCTKWIRQARKELQEILV
ncbi:MAG: sigma-70 family RNA polymerase sigma factor [Ferrimicrobium sp.]